MFWLLWHPLVGQHGLVWYFLIMVALFDGLYLMVVINWTSLFPEMFRSLKSRAEVARWRQGIGIVALMIGVSLPPILYGRFGWSTMGALLAVVGTLGFLAVVWGGRGNPQTTMPAPTTPEPLWHPFWAVLKEPGFIRYLTMNFLVQFVLVLIPAAMPFFGKYVLHLRHSQLSLMLASAFIVAILTVYPWSRLIPRWGSRRSLTTAVGIMTVAVLLYFAAHRFAMGVMASMVLGVGLGGFLMLIDIVMAEIIDAHAARQGVRREGAFYGVNGFILRFGTTLEALIIYLVFHVTGYHANSAGIASPDVRLGIRLLMAGIPAVALLGALWAFRPGPSRFFDGR
ncbi:MAG: MFS transporter [Firmicutes bacterium]|nr:MFS transporter [Bacillota bacterium]